MYEELVGSPCPRLRSQGDKLQAFIPIYEGFLLSNSDHTVFWEIQLIETNW